MAGQQVAEQIHRPAFQRFGQQGMVGVREDAGRHRPRRLPIETMNVDQKPHHLRDRERWMGVVQLDRDLVRQAAER